MYNINFRKLVLVFLNLLIVFSLLAIAKIPTVFACSCTSPGSPTEELGKSTAVFSGTVLDVSRNISGYGYNVKFDVDRTWKGTSNKTVFVSTGLGGGDCGFGFKKSEKYIVYAYGNDEKSLFAVLCSRTHLLNSADTDISALGEGKIPSTVSSETDPVNKSPLTPFSSTTAFAIIIGLILVPIAYKIISSHRKSS